MCHDVHALEDGKKNCVEWDDLGQPVGKGGKSLRTFLGIVARNADKCPINVQSWDKMLQNCIEDVWLFIQKEKTGTDPDRADVFIITHTRKDGRPINEDCAIAIEKLKALKQTQLSTNSSNLVVVKDDGFSKVFGEEKSGRIRGVGTGPTPASLWGRKNEMLKSENKTLHQWIQFLEEKFAKLENKELEEARKLKGTSLELLIMNAKSCSVQNKKKVKLLDLENEQVAEDIVMSIDPKKIVMGSPIAHVYCEVSINYANKPNAPLFVKDDHRFQIKDAIGSHILWIRDYVLVDEAK
ncbi:hypothetical protein Taro_029864 [Colocasia esculenta]|uniref:Uncharacterized protein n=1 Tax=Colocasia esculenta TaxID=4460 RepID=A0A843VK09_COLES|nr:hypothetical protein [Colocasia esculenta]